MALDLLPVIVEELMDIEPLDVSPVAVLDGQPDTVFCDWVVQMVIFFFVILWACHMRGMRSRRGSVYSYINKSEYK